eukprot:gnl/Hemi2/9851_TR3425_c0_g1_i1.p2 gnl/Hemi2/9851_TR3425_c0_g1~~gnl/Hemi2/9851_TR3425_c0_g1_i1.p2  ORF type:complete len:386 (+),score=134.04 gnl/Hemi2/9851_TR3425_c0_g1_i1:75-1160(+)
MASAASSSATSSATSSSSTAGPHHTLLVTRVGSLAGRLRALYYIVFCAATGLLLNAVQLLTVVLLWPTSRYLFRVVNRFLLGLHLPLYAYGACYWGRCPFYFCGDSIPSGEAAMCLLSHPSQVDWIFGFYFALIKDSLAGMKVVVKEEMKRVPVFGFAINCAEYIFLKRDWDADKATLVEGANNLHDFPGNFWTIIFPEGTNFKQWKADKSRQYAQEHGLPVLAYHLNPRSKALAAVLRGLRHRFTALYDGSLFYEKGIPSLPTMLAGEQSFPTHLHVERIPLSEVPTDSDELEHWLQERYRKKDAMIAHCKQHGRFNATYDPSVQASSVYMHSLFLFWTLVFWGQLVGVAFGCRWLLALF